MDYSEVFVAPARPCDEARVQEIERNLGLQLPQGYRELIKSCGGGTVTSEYECSRRYDGCSSTSFEAIDLIYGHGPRGDSVYGYNLDTDACRIAKIWRYPKWGLFIGQGSGTVHTPLLMNISNRAYPDGAIIYLDLEEEEETLIYQDFDELVEDLVDPFVPPMPEGFYDPLKIVFSDDHDHLILRKDDGNDLA